MTGRLFALALGLAVLVVPAGATAQGLGDTAARERERRAKEAAARKKEPPRVFTNEDLAEGRPEEAATSGEQGKQASKAPAPQSSEAGVGSSETRSPTSSEVLSESGENRRGPDQARQQRVSAAQARVSALEQRVRELSDKLNPMSGSFIYGATGSNSPQEEAQVRADLTRAESELAAARQELAAAQEGR